MAHEKTGNPQLKLRIPDKRIQALIERDAKKKKKTRQAIVWEIIAAHYETEVAAPGRGRPKTKVDG